MDEVRVQVVTGLRNSNPVVLEGVFNCNADPCERHGRCHCMCPCAPDEDDNCDDCADL